MKRNDVSCVRLLAAIGFIFLATQYSYGESLKDFATKCDALIGMSVPAFKCSEGQVIPTTNHTFNGTRLGGTCDKPNRLNEECDPDAKFLYLSDSNPDVDIVATCRHRFQAVGSNLYDDIAVIQHNNKNGYTCFYQTLTGKSGDAPKPLTDSDNYWFTPGRTSSINCVACHDNGPFIRSPYISQIQNMPGVNDNMFNRDQPYGFIGKNFVHWKTYKITAQNHDGTPSTCTTSCHKLGLSNQGWTVQGLEEGDIRVPDNEEYEIDHDTCHSLDFYSQASKIVATPYR